MEEQSPRKQEMRETWRTGKSEGAGAAHLEEAERLRKALLEITPQALFEEIAKENRRKRTAAK